MFSCLKFPSLRLPWKKDEENNASKDGKQRKFRRKRLVPPASLYDMYVHQQGVDNNNYDSHTHEVGNANASLCALTVDFVDLIKKYDEELAHKIPKYLENKVRTTKYTIISFLPKNLFEQFHRVANFYFLMLIALNFVPQLQVFAKEVSMLPLIAVLTMQGLKDGFEDYSRYRNDKEINRSIAKAFRR